MRPLDGDWQHLADDLILLFRALAYAYTSYDGQPQTGIMRCSEITESTSSVQCRGNSSLPDSYMLFHEDMEEGSINKNDSLDGTAPLQPSESKSYRAGQATSTVETFPLKSGVRTICTVYPLSRYGTTRCEMYSMLRQLRKHAPAIKRRVLATSSLKKIIAALRVRFRSKQKDFH